MGYSGVWAIFCVATLLPALALSGQSREPDDPWQQWKFLIGDWVGSGSGQPGEGIGSFSMARELDGKILVRKAVTAYPPKPGEKTGLRHEDLTIIYPSQSGDGGCRAVYFDNEGHVIHYVVTVSAKEPSVVFESEESAGAPRFRLEYATVSGGEVLVTFSIAPPGRPYRTYVQGKVRRKD